MMREYGASFGIGFVAGMRTISACVALTWAASQGRSRGDLVPAGPLARALATTAAAAEMAGDKMPFAPDRRIPPSFAFRLAIGAVGGWALSGGRAQPGYGALAGVEGSLLGRAARNGDSRTAAGRTWGLAEDAAATGLAALVVISAERKRAS